MIISRAGRGACALSNGFGEGALACKRTIRHHAAAIPSQRRRAGKINSCQILILRLVLALATGSSVALSRRAETVLARKASSFGSIDRCRLSSNSRAVFIADPLLLIFAAQF